MVKSRSLQDMANGPDGEGKGADGLKCPRCDCRNFKVRDTVPWQDGVKRYRECRVCGFRLTTIENAIGHGPEA